MALADDDRKIIARLSKVVADQRDKMPGKPAIEVPIESLHFYDRDGPGDLHCVVDMEQIVWLAENILRGAPE